VRRTVLFAVSGLLVSACGGSVVIDVSKNPERQDAGNADAAADAACMILETNYDQTCEVDGDCSEISAGDYCSARCDCPGGAAINVHDLARYDADIANTPFGSGAIPAANCLCVGSAGPCCRSGTCTMECVSSNDTLPVCSEAGGSCSLSASACDGASVPRLGPSDSCAFADEQCCLLQ
jgi:hypothetical protein